MANLNVPTAGLELRDLLRRQRMHEERCRPWYCCDSCELFELKKYSCTAVGFYLTESACADSRRAGSADGRGQQVYGIDRLGGTSPHAQASYAS